MNSASSSVKQSPIPDYLNFPLYQEQVQKFKIPHGVKIGDEMFSLRFMVSPYNCAVKFCGRLTQHVFDKDCNPVSMLTQAHHKIFQDNKEAILAELSEWASKGSNFPALATNNPFFPTDGGHYNVNQFIYADDIKKENQGTWYSAFPALIKELEAHGWAVAYGPEFHNVTYNTVSSTHRSKLSRVYLLTPPAYTCLIKDYKKKA